ncbi:MAG TPA: glycosyltransferase family 4 protein [Candidatus Bathyarchaeia archaeon]|jgi:glycosyltransferase involved in cell wall biosynthesis|nr:glycosyltransferase family 4 protein [Candidatus Bathyarchaeia archaeon]
MSWDKDLNPDNLCLTLQPNGKPTVGIVVCVWPRLSETFILNEVIGLERLGARLRIFSLKAPKDELVHARVKDVCAPVTCLSIKQNKRAIWLANIRLFCRRPVRYSRTIFEAMGYGRFSVLRRFFQAGYLAEILLREPLTYLHGHFAHTSAIVCMFTHRLTGIPYGFTAHAKDIYVETPRELLRAEAHNAQSVITCTEYNRRYLSTLIDPPGNHKLHRIYHGLELSDFNFCCSRALNGEPPVILSVARLIEKKGLSDLILAAELLRQRGRRFQVQIVGNGPLRQSLEGHVKQLGLHDQVKFLGPLPHDRVCRLYQRVCLFALPCVVAANGDRDGIPNVLLEAMASGVPVVSTPVSGIPELIQSEVEGLLVPSNSPAKLADALDRLLDSPELRERLACAARSKIEACFSIERNSAKLLSLFDQAATNGARATHQTKELSATGAQIRELARREVEDFGE